MLVYRVGSMLLEEARVERGKLIAGPVSVGLMLSRLSDAVCLPRYRLVGLLCVEIRYG